MELRPFGPTGVSVAVVGQGTWMMEGAPDRSVEALRRGIEAGATHVDTAEMYGSGRVEKIVGEAIRGLREKVFLVSKVLPQNASYSGTIEACERSLRALETDHLDVYLLHWPGTHPLEETIRAFEALVRDGKIRYYGVSNFDVEEMEEAVRIAGPGKIVCNQVLYHLKERAIEHAVLPWCAERGIAVVAYSPFGQGDFPRLAAVEGATPRQAALRFLLRHEHVFVIPKASDLRHAQENAAAGSLRLSPAALKRLDKAFPRGAPRGLPML